MDDQVIEPTSDQCTARAKVGPGWACWYPQMGGYVGKAIVVPSDTCVVVWVWHDGDFPFGGEDGNPARLHHCSGEQFIKFGEFLREVTQR